MNHPNKQTLGELENILHRFGYKLQCAMRIVIDGDEEVTPVQVNKKELIEFCKRLTGETENEQ